MLRLLGIALWLMIGFATAAGIYWGFLSTPESSVPALLLSAALTLAALFVAAITVNGASLAWSHGWSRAMFARSLSGVSAFIPAALMAAVVWWLTDLALGWVSESSGQISAWFIVRFGWADPSSFFTSMVWSGRWLQYVLGPMLALSLLGSLLAGEWAADRWRWLARACSPFRLTASTVWVAVFIATPWLYIVPWRPRNLPPSTIELGFVVTKLAVVAVLAAVGLALVIRESAPLTTEATAPSR